MSEQPEKFGHGAVRGSFKSYLTGFILSVELTLVAYWLIVDRVFSDNLLIWAILGLAFIQLVVQLVYFLHLDKESNPRWNLMVFSFMAIVLVIIVFGSLWIMHNLNYHQISPQQLDKSIIKDEGY